MSEISIHALKQQLPSGEFDPKPNTFKDVSSMMMNDVRTITVHLVDDPKTKSMPHADNLVSTLSEIEIPLWRLSTHSESNNQITSKEKLIVEVNENRGVLVGNGQLRITEVDNRHDFNGQRSQYKLYPVSYTKTYEVRDGKLIGVGTKYRNGEMQSEKEQSQDYQFDDSAISKKVRLEDVISAYKRWRESTVQMIIANSKGDFVQLVGSGSANEAPG